MMRCVRLVLVNLMFMMTFIYSYQLFAALPELIPRAVLFGNPVKTMARISPDGKLYAYLAPSEGGVLNIWLQDMKQSSANMITHDQSRGIRSYEWAADGQHILYVQDNAGDENWHLYSVDVKTDKTVDLTPFNGVKVEGLMVDKHFPNEILIGLNKRDPKVFDIYRINLNTNRMTLDTQNPGDVTGWLADSQFKIRAAYATNSKDGSTFIRVRDNLSSKWRTLITWPFGESGSMVVFTKDGKQLYITSSLQTDTTQLQLINVASGKITKTLATDPHSDVDDVLINDDNDSVQAVSFNYLSPSWLVLDPSVKVDFERLQAFANNHFEIISRDASQNTWIIAVLPDNASPSYYRYDHKTGKMQLLFYTKPALQHYKLSSMKALTIPTRDDKQLVSYLSLPVGVSHKHLPLVLDVHGGPWARDTWGYNPEAQWLTNRGYAVLQVNFRGSTGFGKRFLNAGNGQWGVGTMQHDLTDAVQWAIHQGIADAKRICIYGGSYGGYAVLAGLTFTPDLYVCGVDIVGPANLQTLIASIPPYWENGKKEMLLRIGNVEKNNAFNEKVSPLFHINNIKSALLIAQGANDPRVKISQADAIVNAMRLKKLAIDYIVYTDEGHGFARPENRLDFYGRAEAFLAKYLGGRQQPVEKIPNSSAVVR